MSKQDINSLFASFLKCRDEGINNSDYSDALLDKKFSAVLSVREISDRLKNVSDELVKLNEILNSDKETVEKNILDAIQKAHESSTKTMKDRMNDLTGGLNFNLPGFDDKDS